MFTLISKKIIWYLYHSRNSGPVADPIERIPLGGFSRPFDAGQFVSPLYIGPYWSSAQEDKIRIWWYHHSTIRYGILNDDQSISSRREQTKFGRGSQHRNEYCKFFTFFFFWCWFPFLKPRNAPNGDFTLGNRPKGETNRPIIERKEEEVQSVFGIWK